MRACQLNDAATHSKRCTLCRYWFGRCCHALALMEGDHAAPANCSHFITETAPPLRLSEGAR